MKMKKWQYIALAIYGAAAIALLFVATTSAAGNVFGTAWSLMPPVLAIGVDELSVSPHAVLPLRHAIRHIDMSQRRGKLLAALERGEPEI